MCKNSDGNFYQYLVAFSGKLETSQLCWNLFILHSSSAQHSSSLILLKSHVSRFSVTHTPWLEKILAKTNRPSLFLPLEHSTPTSPTPGSSKCVHNPLSSRVSLYSLFSKPSSPRSPCQLPKPLTFSPDPRRCPPKLPHPLSPATTRLHLQSHKPYPRVPLALPARQGACPRPYHRRTHL